MDIQAAQQAGSQVAFVFNNVAAYQALVIGTEEQRNAVAALFAART